MSIMWQKDEASFYHNQPGISSSKLKPILKSPKHYLESLNQVVKQTDSMRFGELTHYVLLENGLGSLKLKPDFGDQRVKENKKAKEEWELLHGHEMSATDEVMQALETIEMNARENPLVNEMLDSDVAHKETSIYFTLKNSNGLETAFKSRPDLFILDNCLLDVKTTEDISEFALKATIKKYDYDFQLAFYEWALASIDAVVKEHYILAVENKPPYDVALFALGPSIRASGKDKLNLALHRLEKCILENKWPGVQGESITVLEF